MRVHVCMRMCVRMHMRVYMPACGTGQDGAVDINRKTEREEKASWGYIIHAKKYRALSLDDNGSFRNISPLFPRTRSADG